MIVLSYYPGCSLKTSSSFFEKSITKVLPRFGIGLEELEDWSCCGATAARAVDETLADALVARNLALAEKKARHFFAPCSACYNRAVVTNEKMRTDGKRRAEINNMISPGQCLGTLKITNIIELFRDYVGVEQIAAQAAFDLGDLRVVPYYGCVLTRIPKTEAFDDCEYPQAMDRTLSAAGAKVLDWPYRTECCGASRTVLDKMVTLRLSSLIVDRALSEGAHAIVTSCPLCQMNLDLLPHLGSTGPRLPVLFLTEILELALFGTLTGRRSHMINAGAITEKVRRKEKAGGTRVMDSQASGGAPEMAGAAMTEREARLQFIRKYDSEEAERLERLLARKDAVAAGNAYGERLTERQFSLVFDPLLRNAAESAAILEVLGPDPLTVPALSARLDLDASRVFGHIKELLRRDLVRIAGYEDGNAGFRRKG